MASFDERIQKLVEEGDIPGLVLLAKDKQGRSLYSKAAGRASLEPGNEKRMRTDTVFKLASSSKLLTTIAVLQAVERGLLRLDEDVASYVPVLASQPILTGFAWYGKPMLKPRRKAITVRGLLTQTVGAGYDFLEIQPLWRYRWWNRQAIAGGERVEERYGYPLLHEPGEGWTYGAGITWAGKVLEKASGLTLEEWIQEHICRPLGLASVTFFPDRDPDISARLAAMSKRNAKTGKVEYLPDMHRPESQEDCLGGEGVYASLEDLLAILHSLLVDDERLLKRDTAAMMFTPQLAEAERRAMRECLQHPRWICKTILKKDEYDWAFGGVLVDGDGHERLRRGTLLWSGLFHNLWWIDREAGICGVFGAQITPATDKIAIPLMSEFQAEVYTAGR